MFSGCITGPDLTEVLLSSVQSIRVNYSHSCYGFYIVITIYRSKSGVKEAGVIGVLFGGQRAVGGLAAAPTILVHAGPQGFAPRLKERRAIKKLINDMTLSPLPKSRISTPVDVGLGKAHNATTTQLRIIRQLVSKYPPFLPRG